MGTHVSYDSVTPCQSLSLLLFQEMPIVLKNKLPGPDRGSTSLPASHWAGLQKDMWPTPGMSECDIAG